MKRLPTPLLLTLLAVPALSPAMAIEEPSHTVLRRLDAVEIRAYSPYVVAETVVAASSFDAAGNEGFRRLAGYIFGGNRSRTAADEGAQKIAMTAPVGQRREAGEKIAMTAPVGQRGDAAGWVISFTMPARWTLATLPQPNDSRVTLREVPGRTVAALRFSGLWSEERFAAKTAELLAALARAGLTAVGETETARYNPPFTPWFLRRNEVMVEIAGP